MTDKNWPTYIYLHGFASGPGSTKAQFFVSRLSEMGLSTILPDLNGESFRNLTITNQLKIVHSCLDQSQGNAVIVGSSMGGLLATLAAQKRGEVRALVLLAPGFGLPRRWSQLLGQDGMSKWRSQGYIDVFNYAINAMAPLNYEFVADAEQYQTDDLKVEVPTLVFHGKADDTVPVEESIDFQRNNQQLVTLELLDDGHELIQPLNDMWLTTRNFLTSWKLAPHKHLCDLDSDST